MEHIQRSIHDVLDLRRAKVGDWIHEACKDYTSRQDKANRGSVQSPYEGF